MAWMRQQLPTILLVLALPVGLAGYFAGAAVVDAVMSGGGGILSIFVPLLVAGLCMIPFLAPWLDRRAKADLAEIQRRRADEAGATGKTEPPGTQEGS
jgi:hypothetical protein